MATKKPQHSTGIMNKMRDKTHVVLIILVLAFLAWIALDLGMNIFETNRGNTAFGMINGQEISYTDFENQVQRQIEQIRTQNPNQEIDDAYTQQIREQVWNSLVQQTLINEQIEKMGITVSDNEVLDWVYNRPQTLPDEIKRYFMDSLGVFNVAAYQQVLTSREPQAVQFWKAVEIGLRENLLRQKLFAAITNSVMVTEGDVLRKYKDDNIMAKFSYMLVDINSIKDTSLNNVPDDELRKYYEEHKDEFKQDEAVKLAYVVFTETATAEDSATAKRMLEVLVKDMKNSSVEDSSLIKLVKDNSSTPYNDAYQKPNAISKGVLAFLTKADSGTVSEVIMDDDGFKLVKSLGSKEGTDEFSNASHILVNFGTDTAAAKKKAEDILARVKNGEDINELAFQLSDEPQAKTSKGNLGWFGKGAMVKEFEDAVLSAPIGSVVPNVVKTNFGFHIIKVHDRSKKEYRYAEIKVNVKPGTRSKDLTKLKAEEFFGRVEKGARMDTLAVEYKVPFQLTPEILKDGAIPGIGQNRKLINTFFDAKTGYTNEAVRIPNGYAVYQVVEHIAEGYKNFDSIKTTIIRPKVVLEKKFAILKQKADEIKAKIQNGDLNSVASQYPEFQVQTVDSASVSKPPAQLGQDAQLLTKILDMQNGQLSDPLKGNFGYFIVKMDNVTPFDNNDYLAKAPDIRRQLLQQKQQQVVQEWMADLQAKAEIEDNRNMYYSY
jgi:parvulin-like peptidyl-prolyl isomerase